MRQAAPGKRFRERLTYANVMSTIAVFLALGGATALAAGQLGKNSVGSRQLKSKAVTTGKIANNAINGAKVATDSLTGTDIDLNKLGTVPNAANAAQAGNSQTVGGHAAACPAAHHSLPRHLLRRRLQRPRLLALRGGRKLLQQGRVSADADAALRGSHGAQPRHRNRHGPPVHRRVLRQHQWWFLQDGGDRRHRRSHRVRRKFALPLHLRVSARGLGAQRCRGRPGGGAPGSAAAL